jgi:geranylgeranyl transferase type-2 subunit beta
MSTYLYHQALQLARGAAALPEPTRIRHEKYLTAAQRPDGGFAGREGDSDLYYTSFALRGLFILGALHGSVAERAAAFLTARLAGTEKTIDFMSLVFGASLLDISAGLDVFANQPPQWRDQVDAMLEQLRREDGGYAKAASGRASSTYQSFLVVLCRQLIDRPLPDPERVVQFIHSQRSDDGGFRDIRAAKRGGTNPTAAAIGVLQVLDALDTDLAAGTITFLGAMQNEEGGLRANTRIPIADLLSTCTGLLTLADLDGLNQLDIPAAQRYVQQREVDQGGFHGAAWDREVDVEYTFYGLAASALLAQHGRAGEITRS